MNADLRLSEMRFTEASRADQRNGLIGFVKFVVNDALVVDGVTLRRTADDRLTLSFPMRVHAGRAHFYLRPVDDDARRSIEAQVFSALNFKREAAS